MTDIQIIGALFLIAVILLIVFLLCHSFDICPKLRTWFLSTTEEKVGLTKLKGLYNANGYLVHSSSDLKLFASGSFKRFDSVDRDFKETNLAEKYKGEIGDEGKEEVVIGDEVPLPTSLQSVPITTENLQLKDSIPIFKPSKRDELINGSSVSIAIPRPKSSINITELSSKCSFPVFLSPPPTPVTLSKSPPSIQTVPNVVNTSLEELEQCSAATLQRAISFESVNSDTSVKLTDLEEPTITGYLCLGLEYDSENSYLFVSILEAKELLSFTKEDIVLDTYVRIFLLPDKISNAQTRIYRDSRNPSYKERFLFELHPREQSQKSLCFQVYCFNNLSHTLIGEGEFKLNDASLRQPVTTWVTLTDTGQKSSEFGEIFFSLSYLPTAERLTVVVVKARNLKFKNEREPGDSFVKVYLLQNGKKLSKKKTTTKKNEKCPIFNESIIFNVPAHALQTIQLRLTVSEAISTSISTENESSSSSTSIGHVILGSQATDRPLTHWTQMLTTLRKPVAMWHPLRK